MVNSEFSSLLASALSVELKGWSFSAFSERWIEESPPWNYCDLVVERMRKATSLLDMGTGGGEFLSSLPNLPARVCATESYPPNIPIAKRCLEPLGVDVVGPISDDDLPFEGSSFDIVINRHESYCISEVYRITKPGGRFITQQVGSEDNTLLNRVLEAPRPDTPSPWNVDAITQGIAAGGFRVLDRREAFPQTVFTDVGAVVVYLRAIPWQIPDFAISAYRDRLQRLHEQIQRKGPLRTTSHRILVEAIKE